jgi:hypothetical protein
MKDVSMAQRPPILRECKVRIREPLWRRIAQVAKKRGVSLNAEIARRLEQSFGTEKVRTLDEIIDDIRAKLVNIPAEALEQQWRHERDLQKRSRTLDEIIDDVRLAQMRAGKEIVEIWQRERDPQQPLPPSLPDSITRFEEKCAQLEREAKERQQQQKPEDFFDKVPMPELQQLTREVIADRGAQLQELDELRAEFNEATARVAKIEAQILQLRATRSHKSITQS